MLRACSLAALVMIFCVATACVATVAAQDMRNPKIASVPVDWSEAVAQLDNGMEPSPRSIERLNQAADTLFANIASRPARCRCCCPSTALSYCVTPQRACQMRPRPT